MKARARETFCKASKTQMMKDQCSNAPVAPSNEPSCPRPKVYDVLCGSKNGSILNSAHPGNKVMVATIKQVFQDVPRADDVTTWPGVVESIMGRVGEERFLRKDGSGWVELSTNDMEAAIFEMLHSISNEKLNPPDEASILLHHQFMQLLPLRGARSVAMRLFVMDEVSSNFQMQAAMAAPGLPELFGTVEAGFGKQSIHQNGSVNAYHNTWPKGAVKTMEELTHSGEFSLLEKAHYSPQSLAAELVRILRDKPTGTTYIKVDSDSSKELGGRLRAMQPIKFLFGRNKSSKSQTYLKIDVQWHEEQVDP